MEGTFAAAKEFVRFLVEDGWLAHCLDFSGERLLPPMPKLLEQPFWLDPSDRHRALMRSVLPVPGGVEGGLRHSQADSVIDDPEVRRRLIKAIDSYTAVYRKGCTPPDVASPGDAYRQ